MANTLMILVLFCLSVCFISEGLNKITVEPSDVVEDEPVTLTCTLVPMPDYIIWYRNTDIVAKCGHDYCRDHTSYYYTTTVNRLNGTTSVYIQSASKSSVSGTWICEDMRNGIISANTTLDVKELTGRLTLIPPFDTRFIAGQYIGITCKTKVTYPTTNITWYIDSADNRLTDGITTNIQDGVSTSRLILTSEKQLNNHTLHCSAFNGYGKVQTDFLKLDIKYLPTIHILTEATFIFPAEKTSTVIVKGEQLLLICYGQDANPGVPTHGYTWSRNGIKLTGQTSDIFKVDTTLSHDTNNYTCTGNNGIGTGISSTVKVYADPLVYEDKSGVVSVLAVVLALFMVLSIVLALLVAYLILTIIKSTAKTKESEEISRITPTNAPDNTIINEVSNYDGLELGYRGDNQYARRTNTRIR